MRKIIIIFFLQFVHEKRNNGLDEKFKDIKLNQGIAHENREKLKQVEYDLNESKKELEKVRDSLILHYHRILNEGVDTR